MSRSSIGIHEACDGIGVISGIAIYIKEVCHFTAEEYLCNVYIYHSLQTNKENFMNGLIEVVS